MRYLIFFTVITLLGCTNAEPKDSQPLPEVKQSDVKPLVLEKAGSPPIPLANFKSQSAGWAPPGPPPESLAGLSPGKRRDLEIKYKLGMINAHCSGEAYSHKPYDVTIVPKCERDLTIAVLTEYKMPYLDIWQMKLDKEIAIYEVLQQHKITFAQAQAELSELNVTTNNLINSRIDADYQNDLLESAVTASQQQPIILAPTVTPPINQPTNPSHCDTSVDRAGNGTINCY